MTWIPFRLWTFQTRVQWVDKDCHVGVGDVFNFSKANIWLVVSNKSRQQIKYVCCCNVCIFWKIGKCRTREKLLVMLRYTTMSSWGDSVLSVSLQSPTISKGKISRKKDLRQTLQQCYRFCVVTPQRKIDWFVWKHRQFLVFFHVITVHIWKLVC